MRKRNAIASAAILAPPARLTPLNLWHLLSLDAPTVATTWTVFAARARHTPLPPTLAPTMFLAVWLVYAADRLLDANPFNDHRPGYELQPRHCFPRTHLRPFAAAMLLVAFALAALVPTLPATLLEPYLLLAVLLALWFALIHLTTITLPKELVPGLFFAAAVFLPSRPANLVTPILFAILCTLNCLYIHHWEHPFASRVPHPHDSLSVVGVGLGSGSTAPAQSPAATANLKSPDSHPATRRALRHLPALTLTLAILSLPRPTPISLAVAMAALALFALDHYRHHLTPTTLRAAADLALLTPLLILPFTP